MKAETATVMAKSVTTGSAAAMMFGLTWWALAIAVVGAIASLHFEPEPQATKVPRLVLSVLAVAFAAAMAAVVAPHFALLAWTADVPVEIRAGSLALVVRPGYAIGRKWWDNRTAKREA